MNDRNEERINTVVQAMRQAEPPVGMEQRILARLHTAELPQAKPDWWTLSLPRYALAAVAIAAASGLLLQRHAGKGHTNVAPTLSSRLPERTGPTEAPPNATIKHVGSVGAPSVVAQPIAVRLDIPKKPVAGQHTARSSEDDRSFPAPPLPLTEQERLLLRLVRRESATQLAELSAPAQETAFQRDKQEVTAFFTAPTVVDRQDPQVQSQSNGQQ